MKVEEAIRTLNNFKLDAREPGYFKMIQALGIATTSIEKQIPKKPILIQHPQPYKRDFKCPVCSGDVNRQWEYQHYDDSMIGEDQYEYCPDCGTKIDWSVEE